MIGSILNYPYLNIGHFTFTFTEQVHFQLSRRNLEFFSTEYDQNYDTINLSSCFFVQGIGKAASHLNPPLESLLITLEHSLTMTS